MIRQDLIRRPASCSPRISTPVLPITYAGPLPPRNPPQCEAQPTRSCPAPLNPYPLPNTSCPCHSGAIPNLGAVGIAPYFRTGTKLPCTGASCSSRTGDRGGPCRPRSSPAYEPGPGCSGPGVVCQKRDSFPSPCQASGPPPSPAPVPPTTPSCQCGCRACGERCAAVMPSGRRNYEKPPPSAYFVSPPPAMLNNFGPSGQMGPTFGPARGGRPRCENPYVDPQLRDILGFRRRVLNEQMAFAEAPNYGVYQPPVWYYYDVCPSEYQA